ncbi:MULTISPECIES: tetratricopeptide repeat protein [unclassified Lentimicrobium]|uniref:tetratricopeptide repeat protein n=1 Tax=unclassified Lentimicrobium TaxID=2677434 RepID=UPI001554A3A0|nr:MULTISPECIES: tetratricopeptide repeat protein [unclassified Lentimicrobium]NPD45253.1 tetratricopeptide repeat protein [Lentimicrobium sp. S6]NPD86203.1 tetratricopeptide repeat protein [Lentimicrobium sp. L6]
MKKITYILIIFTVLLNLQAIGDIKSDSLLMELKNARKNKEKSILLNNLSQSFKNTHIDSAVFYAKEGYNYAQGINYQLGIAENAASLGDYYVIYDSLSKARSFYSIASDYFQDLEMDFDYAQVSMVIGNIFLSQGNHSEALFYYHRSQIISEEFDFIDILPHIYNNTGIIYNDLEEKDKALSYYLKAYEGFKEINLKEYLAHTVSNIANIYYQEGNDSLAMEYYSEALSMFKETNNLVDAAIVLTELGQYEILKKNYQKALHYYNEAYDLIYHQESDYLGPRSRSMVMILGNLGRVHFYLGNKEKAKKNLKESLKMAIQNHYADWIEASTFELSKIYESEGQYAKALDYFKTYEQYGDSILNENSIKRITQLEMQFDFDKKMKEIELEDAIKEAEQQRKELIYILLIGLGIFVAIIAFLLFANQRNKTAKVELKRSNLKLEHDKLQQELEHKNKELATNVMYLLSKNEFITNTAEKLTQAKLNFKKENQKIIQDVIRDLLMNSSKDVWKEFEVRFQEVHSDFYNNLNEKYPDLTPNEKKICAFLRLNMSTKDISAITYQSVRSINMARFRLRKKMELETDENLVSILSQI